MRRGLWLLVVLLAACGTPKPAAPRHDVAQATTVVVSRRDITEVVALPATVVATPAFVVLAPVAGTVRREGALFTVDGVAAHVAVPAAFDRWLVPNGTTVAAGVPVAQLTYAGFGEVATLPPQDAYRILAGDLKARATIAGGPGPFDCPVLPAPADAGSAVVCAIPLPVKAFAGLAGTVAVSSRQAGQVLALPVTAVSGTVQTGEVAVVAADGSVSVRPVSLGVTDGSYVEITDGVAEGTRVLAAPPPLEGLP